MNLVIIDTETIRWSTEVVGGFENLQKFGLSLLVIGTARTNGTLEYLRFSPYAKISGFPSFDFDFISFQQTQSIIDQADRIVSFNADNFDFSVLDSAKFSVGGWRTKSFDLLTIFVKAVGHRISLDNLTMCQFQEDKALQTSKLAVEFWRAGLELLRGWSGSSYLNQNCSDHYCRKTAKYLFQTVIDYCEQDVFLTFRLYEYVLKNRQLTFHDGKIKANQTVDLSSIIDSYNFVDNRQVNSR